MKKDNVIHVRCTQKQKNRVMGLARMYSGGNMSELILDWVIESPMRRFVGTKKKRPKEK